MTFHSNLKQHYYTSSVAYDPSNTTFVEADPSNFREVVQRLTGAPPDPFARKLPVTIPGRPFYKLQERRRQQSGRNLEIKLGSGLPAAMMIQVMASPISPLDIVMGLQSPAEKEEEEEEEEEERSAIAEKGFFYFHPSTPRSSEPELLTLFPLYSPQDDPN